MLIILQKENKSILFYSKMLLKLSFLMQCFTVKVLHKGLWQFDKFLLPAGIGDLIAYLDSLGLPEHGGIGLVLKKNRVSSPHTHVESGAP